MKLKFRNLNVLLVFGMLLFATQVLAEEKTKEYNESWSAASMETLQIDNKFGEIKITNSGGSDVTIDVVITVEAPNEKKAEELLEQINVEFGKSGNTVKAETVIDSDFKSRNDFSIDYMVNIPSDKNLDITNKYGNTIVNVLNASGNFDIKYGNLTANELNTPASGSMKVTLGYGKADISSSNDISVIVSYSTINFGETDDLELESKYAVINLGEASSIKADSKYDTYNFEEVESLTANTKYTHIKIEELSKTLKIDAGYGGIRVDEVGDNFQSINVSNSYGQVAIGLDGASYSIDAECDYCGISYPEENFTGNRVKENHTQKLEGNVGTGGGSVVVKSRYGQIKLR